MSALWLLIGLFLGLGVAVCARRRARELESLLRDWVERATFAVSTGTPDEPICIGCGRIFGSPASCAATCLRVRTLWALQGKEPTDH